MAMSRVAQRGQLVAERSCVEILRSARIFADLPDDALARLADSCVARTYRRGQYLWYQGDEGTSLIVVASGLVKVVISSENGDEVVLVTLGPGETIGELALLDGAPRSASLIAVTPTTVVMLPRAVMLDLINRQPTVLDALLRALGTLVRRLTEQTGDLVFLDLGGRVAKLLLRLAEPQTNDDGSITLEVRLSQSDLAGLVGATRPAVNRILHTLAARGLISVDGQVIFLRNLPALRRRAEI